MALVVADRVREQTTTTGTGTYTLAGAVLGHQAFSAVGDGNTTYYCCTDGTDWEVGTGTYTASGTTLARTTVHASTNGGSAVDWSAGTRNIYSGLPATVLDGLVNAAATGDVSGPGSSTDNAVTRMDGTTGKLIQNSNATLADNGGLTQTAAAATEVLGSFIAHATQSANMSEWKSSGGTVGAHVTESQAFHNTGGGTNSCVYGDGAGVDGDEPNCTSVGVNAICYGDDAVAIGYGATAGGSGSIAYQDNVAIGSGALSVISSGVAIGAGATTGSSSSSTAIGALASVTGNSSVAIGAGATVTGAFGVAIGQGTSSSTGSGVTIGRSAQMAPMRSDTTLTLRVMLQAQAWGTSCVAGAIGAVAMGYAANASHSGAICIGDRATSTAAYQLVIGSDYLSGSVKINDVYIGEGVTSASPDGVTINSTGGKGTDIAGSDITIAGGKGTGSATGGDVKFATSAPGATGTTLRSLADKLRIGYDGTTLIAQTNTPGTPASGEMVQYMKGSKLIYAYDDGGTVRYKYLDMAGTGVTWVHTTSAP
jgi:trimeric autotransporter adhesin